MAKTLANLTDEVESILEDGTNLIFSTATIATELDKGLREISHYAPYKVRHTLTARHKSREVDITSLPNLIEPLYAIYPVLLKDKDGNLIDDEDLYDSRRNIEWFGNTVRMSLGCAPSAEETDTLTGTVTFTAGSTAVTGVGTLFTTELRPGYYIQKSGSTNWYRISSVTDATNLVLSKQVATADTGADTVSLTKFWQNDVYLYCDTVHYLTTQTDVAGAIDSGIATGYAEGTWSIHVDGLGTGTIYKGTILTIAGTDGEYRVTADATIGTNEADLLIEPILLDRAIENAVVTFLPSSLTPPLERLLSELTAARCAINWVGDGRTQIDSAVSTLTTTATAIGNMSARITAAIADILLGRTPLALVEDRVTQAQTDMGTARTTTSGMATDLDTLLGNIAARLTESTGDLTSSEALFNTITVGANPAVEYYRKAMAELSNANAYISQARIRLSEGNSANVYSTLASREMSAGNIYRSQADGYGASAARELQAANTYLNQASGYLREVTTRTNTANIIQSYQRWGEQKLNRVLQELRGISRPRVFHTYAEY